MQYISISIVIVDLILIFISIYKDIRDNLIVLMEGWSTHLEAGRGTLIVDLCRHSVFKVKVAGIVVLARFKVV